MMKKASVVTLCSCLFAGSLLSSAPGCHKSVSPIDEPNGTDECGDIKSAILPIYNGSSSPTLLSLSEYQQRAVGALGISGGEGDYMCTGVLVAPDIVLTAAHCVTQAGGVAFPFEAAALEHLYEITKGHPRTACGISQLAIEVAALRDGRVTSEIIDQASQKRFTD